MKISFEEELDHRSLILEKENISANEYVYPMLAHNQIQELLPVRIKSKNGENCLSYDVTSGISLTDTFAARSMNSSEVRRVLFGLRDAVNSLSGCLLDSRDLCLDPDEIFLFSSPECVRFCFVPHLSETQAHSVRQLSEFLLRHADHSDGTAVELVYSFYEEVSRENYSLSDILKKLLSQAEVPGGAGNAAQNAGSPVSGSKTSGKADGSNGTPAAGQPSFNPSAADYSSYGKSFSDHANVQKAASGRPVDYKTGSRRLSGNNFSIRSSSKNNQAGHRMSHNAQSIRSSGRNAADSHSRNRKGSTTGNRRRGYRNKASAAQQSGSRRKSSFQKHRTLIILCACTAAAAAAVSIIFRFDLVQIAGMGFLCVAAVWLIYGSLHNRSADVNNVWADELADEPDDDTFYQNLLHEMYQTDAAGLGASTAQSPAAAAQNSISASSASVPFSPSQSSYFGQAPASSSSLPRRPAQDFRQQASAYSNTATGSSMAVSDPYSSGPRQGGPGTSGSSVDFASLEKDGAIPDGATRLVSGAEPAMPLLISDHPGTIQNIFLEKGHLLIGKNEAKVDVVLNSSVISRIHARLDYSQEDGLTVTDLFSTNGTFVNGRRLEANRPATLTNGQRLSFADLSFRVLLPNLYDRSETVSKVD